MKVWVTPKGETSEREDKEVEDGPTGWSHSKVRGRREGSRVVKRPSKRYG